MKQKAWGPGLRVGFCPKYQAPPHMSGGAALKDEALQLLSGPRKDADPSTYRVHAGDVYLYGDQVLLNVSLIIVHPDYVHPELGADVALFQLAESVDRTANMKPIRLSSASPEVTEGQCWVTGWGSVSMHGMLGRRGDSGWGGLWVGSLGAQGGGEGAGWHRGRLWFAPPAARVLPLGDSATRWGGSVTC